MRAPSIWYIVMNGHEARILNNLKDAHDPEHEEIVLGGPGRKERDTLNDRPSRSYSSAGGGMRSAVESGSDPLREDAREFLREVYDRLEHDRQAGSFESLVLIGTPEIVGLWRQTVPEQIKACVHDEFIKNLVNLSPAELVQTVRELAD